MGSILFKRAWRKTFKKHYPDEAASLMQQLTAKHATLYAERKDYGTKALNDHLRKHILAGLAVYFTLQEAGKSKEESYKIVQAGFRSAIQITRNLFSWLGKYPYFYTLIKNKTKDLMLKEFPAPGWEMEWLTADDNEVSFNLHQCFYVDVLTEYGVPELTPAFCDLDSFLYDGVSPHMRFGRTQTIGKGGAYCNFRFIHISPDDIQINE